jgi:hypothetical protein
MRIRAVLRSIINRLRGTERPRKRSPQQESGPEASADARPKIKPLSQSATRSRSGAPSSGRRPSPWGSPIASQGGADAEPYAQALSYMGRVHAKLNQLAEDFNAGSINRAQFKNLYIHYQHEIRTVERMVESAPDSESWKGVVTEGQSLFIRRRHLARAEGYAIYENDSGMPMSTLGRFELDPALLVPMLSSYRTAAREIFGAGMRFTETEDGRWLCFVPGEFTTLLAVFSTEPAGKQLQFLEDLHRLFEKANRRRLANQPVDASRLLFPHENYLGLWRR